MVLGPVTREVEEGFLRDISGEIPLGMVVPDLEGDIAGGVGDGPFEVGFATLGFLLFVVLDLRAKTRLTRCFVGGAP